MHTPLVSRMGFGLCFVFWVCVLCFGCVLCSCRVLYLWVFFVVFEKSDVSAKKGLRVSASIRRTPFTGVAEAYDGASDGPAVETKATRRTRILR
jgi:hypothetical protein